MKIVNFSLRLPSELHKKLSEIAFTEMRSLHAQILLFLQQAVEHYENEQKNKKKADK